MADTPLARLRARTEQRDWAQWDEEHEGSGRTEAEAHETFSSKAGLDARTYDALNTYTYHGNETINGVLRSPEEWNQPFRANEVENARKDADLISAAMKPTPADATTYRGMNAHTVAAALGVPPGDYQGMVGGVIHDAGFVSTSHSLEKAVGFTGSQSGVIFAVHVPEGTKAIDMSKFGSSPQLIAEKELLLDRGTSFRVTSVETPEDGQPILHVEAVQGG